MSNFDRAFQELMGVEGGYVNNPNDPGGETNWGITVVTARKHGYVGDMRSMDQTVAKTIYRAQFWLPEFNDMSYELAFTIFDGAVNSGPGQAVRWLQRAVGVADDGKLGPVTLAAVDEHDMQSTIMLINAERLEFMTRLKNWTNASRGWARRIALNLRKGASK